MLVCFPQQLDEPVASAVHRLPLEPVIASPGKDDDDVRTVIVLQPSGQRIDDASGGQILVLQIDGVPCRRDGRKVERLHLSDFIATVQLGQGARDCDIDVAQSRFQLARPGDVPGVDRRQRLARRCLPPLPRLFS